MNLAPGTPGHKLSYIFTGGEAVSRAVADLCPLLVGTIVLCGIQPVLSGVAVGCGWQALVAYINIGCYYFIGVPLGALLGFKFDYGIKGIVGRHDWRHAHPNHYTIVDHIPN
uniref:Uncharacterized protein n=1 Tax=Aegilops tauschii subsp. strangulata TaxID=200361 RepID=A0A453BE46_AEGTS